MKIFGTFLFALLLLSCGKNSSKTEEQAVETNTSVNEAKYSVHTYKVSGLNDTIIADSVWKMIISIEGIEELVLDKKDSLVIIKTEDSLVEIRNLEEELEKRGAKILKTLS